MSTLEPFLKIIKTHTCVKEIFKRSFFTKSGKTRHGDLASLAVITERRMLPLSCLFLIIILQIWSSAASVAVRCRTQRMLSASCVCLPSLSLPWCKPVRSHHLRACLSSSSVLALVNLGGKAHFTIRGPSHAKHPAHSSLFLTPEELQIVSHSWGTPDHPFSPLCLLSPYTNLSALSTDPENPGTTPKCRHYHTSQHNSLLWQWVTTFTLFPKKPGTARSRLSHGTLEGGWLLKGVQQNRQRWDFSPL